MRPDQHLPPSVAEHAFQLSSLSGMNPSAQADAGEVKCQNRLLARPIKALLG